MAALAEEKGGPVAADGRLSGVEDGVEVAVDPVIVARHRRRRRGDPGEIGGRNGRAGGEEGGRKGEEEVRRNSQVKKYGVTTKKRVWELLLLKRKKRGKVLLYKYNGGE